MPGNRPSAFGQDEAFNNLVRLVEEEEEGRPIGLGMLVNGAFVTGRLISRSAWAAAMSKSGEPDTVWAFRHLLKIPTAPTGINTEDGIEGEAEPSGRYAHLQDVQVTVGNHQFSIELFRLRSDTVNGWAPVKLP